MSIRTDIEMYAGDISEYSDNELGHQLGQAVANAYSALPDSLLIESTTSPIILDTTNTSADISNKTIIYVTRLNASSKRKLCLEVNPLHWDKYSDTGSIYRATIENPVYTITNNAGVPTLEVAPVVTGDTLANTAKIYWRSSNDNLSSQLDDENIANFPVKARRFVLLNTALGVMSLKLKDATTEEEDGELAQLIQMNMQVLKSLLDSEMFRLKREESTPFDDQALQQMEEPTKGKSTKR